MKLKVRRAQALRSSRLDAVAVRADEANRLAKIAAELTEIRGFLRKCGVTRAVVLRDRVFFEVTRFRPPTVALSGIACAVMFAVLLGVNWLTPGLLTLLSGLEPKGLVLGVLALIGLPYLAAFGAFTWFWRSRVIRFEVPLREWAAPRGRLLVFVHEAENAVALTGGVEDSNRRLCVAAAQIPGARRLFSHSAFSRFRMELKRVRGA